LPHFIGADDFATAVTGSKWPVPSSSCGGCRPILLKNSFGDLSWKSKGFKKAVIGRAQGTAPFYDLRSQLLSMRRPAHLCRIFKRISIRQ
jgi:hypothetical protein